MKRIFAASFIAALVGVSSPNPALADGEVDAKDWLTFCVGNHQPTVDKIKGFVAGACSVSQGNKTKCSKTAGTPWICSKPISNSNPTQPGEKDYCAYNTKEISFTIETPLPGGWTAEAGAGIKFTYSGKKTLKGTCGADPRDPLPATGKGGSFVSENGSILVEVEYDVTGTLKVKGPGGLGVNLSGKAKCENGATFDFYKTEEVDHCPCASVTARTATGEEFIACEGDPTLEEPDVEIIDTPVSETPPEEEPLPETPLPEPLPETPLPEAPSTEQHSDAS